MFCFARMAAARGVRATRPGLRSTRAPSIISSNLRRSWTSKARAAFEISIKDAKALLVYFETASKSGPREGEVMKRASLVMALTAWETYVEDRVTEGVAAHLRAVSGSQVATFMTGRLEDELKRFHNPTAEKTRRLFSDYLAVDVTLGWQWQHFDPARARRTLDELIAKRGDAVHRSKPVVTGAPPAPHLIKKDELVKAIAFRRALVEATDRTVEMAT